MKTLLNIFTYLMFLCFSITILIGAFVLSDLIFDGFIKFTDTPLKFPKLMEDIIFAGCMCVVMVVNYFLPDFWKKHFKLESTKPNRERKRNFTITGLLIDENDKE